MSSHLTALAQLERLGFPDLLLWLLTFAVVYGVLSQIKKPESAVSRLIISIVSGLLVLMAVPASLIAVISNMSINLVFILVGLLVLMIFLEVTGVKVGLSSTAEFDEKGKYKGSKKTETKHPFEVHGLSLGIILLMIAVLIFVGSGGLTLVGLNSINLQGGNMLTIGFFAVIVIAVILLLKEEEGE